MRLPSWRAIQSDQTAANLDRQKLAERLARLVGGVVAPAASAGIEATKPAVTEAVPLPEPKPLNEASSIETKPSSIETKPSIPGNVSEAQVASIQAIVPYRGAALVPSPAPLARKTSRDETNRRRRRYGFWLFFAGLVAVFFLVRAIPADWEIGPFRIDASGNAADASASLYFADDPRAPFWLLVPTFNLPPRFFAARPNGSSRPVALGPGLSPTPSGSLRPTAGATPTSTASTSRPKPPVSCAARRSTRSRARDTRWCRRAGPASRC